METKQKHMASRLGISPSYFSLILKGEKPISYQVAESLSRIFPEKNEAEWRKANPAEIKRAFQGAAA